MPSEKTMQLARYYKHWPVFATIPHGWKKDKNAGSPLCGYVFITNGQSVLSGNHKRALALVAKQMILPLTEKHTMAHPTLKPAQPPVIIDENYRKTLNDCARKKTQEILLRDILLDISVCKLEGWDNKSYINELAELVNSFIKTTESPTDEQA